MSVLPYHQDVNTPTMHQDQNRPTLDGTAAEFPVVGSAPSTPPSKLIQPTFLDGSPASVCSNRSSELSDSVMSSDSTLIGSVQKHSPTGTPSIMSARSSPTSPPALTIHPSPERLTSPAMSDEPRPTADSTSAFSDSHLAQEDIAAALPDLSKSQVERVTKLVDAVVTRIESKIDDVLEQKNSISQAFGDYKTAAEKHAENLQKSVDRLGMGQEQAIKKATKELPRSTRCRSGSCSCRSCCG